MKNHRCSYTRAALLLGSSKLALARTMLPFDWAKAMLSARAEAKVFGR